TARVPLCSASVPPKPLLLPVSARVPLAAPPTRLSVPVPDSDPENVVTAALDSVSVLLPLTLTAPLNVKGVLPPSLTRPLVPPGLVRLTSLLTVVGRLA